MWISPFDSEELKEAKRNYNNYNKMVDSVEDALSSINSCMDYIADTVNYEKEGMNSYNDTASGKYKTIYDGICGRHSERLDNICNYFYDARDTLANKLAEYEDELQYWNGQVSSIKESE